VASGLRERIVTALVIAAIVIGVLGWMPAWVALPVIAAVFVAGAWEWAGFAGFRSSAGRALYVVAIGAAAAVAWPLTQDPASLTIFLGAAALWWLVAFLWLALAFGKGGNAAAAVSGFPVLVPAAVGLARLVLVAPNGRMLLLFLLVLIAAADVGAYFGGRALGRHKLAPRVSPGKTWEGFVTGMLAAAATAVAGAWMFGVPVPAWVALCVLVALVSVVGDLFESMFKRRAGLKDSGTLLPGHGGVLDRVDSITAACPTFLLGLYALGLPA
jgi:phosphatidate cytidylyltransferase